jgi:hypothetical protein
MLAMAPPFAPLSANPLFTVSAPNFFPPLRGFSPLLLSYFKNTRKPLADALSEAIILIFCGKFRFCAELKAVASRPG